MQILLLGSGGREHALAWRLARAPSVQHIYVVPGNGGTASGDDPKISNMSDVRAEDFPGLVQFAKQKQIDLVVPGPDALVVDGIEGFFREANIPCFAPSKRSAQLEGSKAYAKDFMQRHNIPTAQYATFNRSQYDAACQHIRDVDYNVVVKASGLAAGKGVICAETKDEALDALRQIMLDRSFGDSGDEVVIEEYLDGYEISILTFCDGTTFRSLPPAQDHKRIFDGDKGPNTGGMGTYGPVDLVSKELLAAIDREVLEPTFRALRAEADPFVGCLFTGFMMTPQGPRLLEYNVRFGDPETETLLPLFDDATDLAQVMLACTQGRLADVHFDVRPGYSAVVFLASGGYPGSYPSGIPMEIQQDPTAAAHTTLFHAGTKLDASTNTLRTAGGRVLAVQALGASLRDALDRAYAGVDRVHFEGKQFRRDIAHRYVGRR